MNKEKKENNDKENLILEYIRYYHDSVVISSWKEGKCFFYYDEFCFLVNNEKPDSDYWLNNIKLVLYPKNDYPDSVETTLRIGETKKETTLRLEHNVWSPLSFHIAIKNNIDLFNLIEYGYADNVHTLKENPYDDKIYEILSNKGQYIIK